MLYRCRTCNYEEARGCLPTTTCGLLLLLQMGISAAIFIPAIRFIRTSLHSDATLGPADTGTGWGWWALLLVPLSMILGFAVLFIAAMMLNAIMELGEWLTFSLRRCPNCGRRRWSWGFTRGFGL